MISVFFTNFYIYAFLHPPRLIRVTGEGIMQQLTIWGGTGKAIVAPRANLGYPSNRPKMTEIWGSGFSVPD